MLFHSAIPLTVWRASCCSELNTFDVKTLCDYRMSVSLFWSLVGPRKPLTARLTDRLRLCKHCYDSCVFSSSCLVSIDDLPSSDFTNCYVCALFAFPQNILLLDAWWRNVESTDMQVIVLTTCLCILFKLIPWPLDLDLYLDSPPDISSVWFRVNGPWYTNWWN